MWINRLRTISAIFTTNIISLNTKPFHLAKLKLERKNWPWKSQHRPCLPLDNAGLAGARFDVSRVALGAFLVLAITRPARPGHLHVEGGLGVFAVVPRVRLVQGEHVIGHQVRADVVFGVERRRRGGSGGRTRFAERRPSLHLPLRRRACGGVTGLRRLQLERRHRPLPFVVYRRAHRSGRDGRVVEFGRQQARFRNRYLVAIEIHRFWTARRFCVDRVESALDGTLLFIISQPVGVVAGVLLFPRCPILFGAHLAGGKLLVYVEDLGLGHRGFVGVG